MRKNGASLEFSIGKARKAQICLAKKVVTEDRLPKEIKRVAGVDVAYQDDWAFGAVAVLDYLSLKVLETQTSIQKVKFPYVPTLLAFRELPLALSAIRQLKTNPDVFLVDGHGTAHPYKCGFASHLGVAIGKSTVGVAKSKLVGETQRVRGEVLLVLDGEIVGAEVNTRKAIKPVYVSIGHLVSLQTAIRIVKHCSRQRIPEPILQAHNLASENRKAKMAKLENRVSGGMRIEP